MGNSGDYRTAFPSSKIETVTLFNVRLCESVMITEVKKKKNLLETEYFISETDMVFFRTHMLNDFQLAFLVSAEIK